MPVFSVILPSYNRAAMLRSALKTALWQELSDWECLVVDDGSTDGTAAALAEFAGEPRVRALRNEKNLGMNASRNRAIEAARGEWVTFLDSDDLWLPRRLSAFAARAAERPEAGFLFSNAFVYRYGRVTGALFDPERPIPEGVVPGHYAVGDRQLPYVTTNVAIRREAFSRWGLFRTEMKTLDTELFVRFLAAGLPVAAIREPLSVRRLHEGQLTTRALENFEEALEALRSSGASEEEQRRRRRELAREVAGYLVKGGEPLAARGLLERELGEEARFAPVYAASFVPASLLNALRGGRAAWLRLRHHPAWAGGAEAEALRLIAPLLAEETQTAKR